MSFIMKAPYPGAKTTTLLPSPKWGDSKSLTASVKSMRAIDGTLYTYVRSKNGKKRFQWEFEIARNKALELREFINSYQSSLVHVTDHDGDCWIGYLLNNPFEFMAAGGAGLDWPGNETMTARLEFEEK